MNDRRLEDISFDIMKECCKKRNIHIVDEDIEEKIKKYPELNKEKSVDVVKKYLKRRHIKFTTFD